MSANFRIGDNTEINLLKWETIEEVFDDLYEKEDEDFQLLIDTYTTYKSDDLLKEMILEIYQNIRE
jgi:ATP-dependent helicase/nuclease subunit A